jgi:tRNA threonylcarbamoyladenosine biosynthesis protein TsaB
MTAINLLALDTSGDKCSVFLLCTNRTYHRFSTGRQRTEQLLPHIQQLLDEAGISLSELDALSFTRGPGSFTGIRLAASIIQGLVWGANLPVIPIPTLQAIAESAYIEHGAQQVAVAINAYGGSIYWGVYQVIEGHMSPMCPDVLCSPKDARLPTGAGEPLVISGAGDAWGIYAEPLSHIGVQSIYPEQHADAKYVASLAFADFIAGKYVSAAEALPVYLYGAERWQLQH